MTGLRELVARGAAASLARQRDDGSFAAGRSGSCGDVETPVRNTGHWLVSLCAAWRWSGDERLRDAALAASRYLASDEARPGGATFAHRLTHDGDAGHGLVGQAWSIEALVAAADAFDAPHLSELAQHVFRLHPFDADRGLWRCVAVNGSLRPWERSFAHQLWFAATGALLAPFAAAEVTAQVTRFLDCLARNLALHPDGMLRRDVSPRAFAWREPRLAVRLLHARLRKSPQQALEEVGDHAFQLYALALLRRHAPDHPFWSGRKFASLWRFARSAEHRQALASNATAWRTHPTGIEMAFALETLEGPAARADAEAWLGEQLARHWDPASQGMRRDAPDPDTLAARLYEAVRLPDLTVPAVLDPPVAAAARG